MKDKYLPIGSVVILKGGKKKVMITGYFSVEGNNIDKIYDYNGCLFPEGYLRSDQTCLFNHEQIEEVFFMGLENEEQKKFKEWLLSFSNQFHKVEIDTLDIDEA